MKPLPLPIAVRAFAMPTKKTQKRAKKKPGQKAKPDFTLVFAVHPSSDYSQKLLWGMYRVFEGKNLVVEGLFYADDLPKTEIRNLQANCAANSLRCLTRKVFLKKVFYAIAFQVRGAIVSFDLPFGISRLAEGWSRGRKFYEGGFNFNMVNYTDKDGQQVPDSFTPRISIKSMDSHRAMIGFTSVRDSIRARLPQFPDYRCEFIDARTLAFALTGERHDLDSACRSFEISCQEGKDPLREDKCFTPLLERVKKISDLYFALIEELEKHPIYLSPSRAFSSASIGKAYLRNMGIRVPSLRINPKLKASKSDVYGWAMTSYFGGRTETRVTKMKVPVVYCDFISMYPTVNALMGNWEFLCAKEIIVEDATDQIGEMVKRIKVKDLYVPSIWKELAVLVQVRPNSDILPMRARFTNSPGATFTTALNPLTSETPLWFTLADVLTSALLSGKFPEILRAVRLTPNGIQSNLTKINLRNTTEFDPMTEDFFKLIVEEKYRQGEGSEAQRIKRFLKTMNNSTCYGIFVELNRQEEEAEVEVHGVDRFRTNVDHPELPGDYFFPPLATFIPGAARLMLALAEMELTMIGGNYAFMDTDSIAIISTPNGEQIRMPGGKEKLEHGAEAIRLFLGGSWKIFAESSRSLIRTTHQLFRAVFSGLRTRIFAWLALHCENRRQLYCYPVSSKRYALFNEMSDGILLKKFTEHRLGNHLPPIDPLMGKPVKDWQEYAWRRILAEGLQIKSPNRPNWGSQLALTELSIPNPLILNWFSKWKKPRYSETVKPYNRFVHVALKEGRPSREERITLVSPQTANRENNLWFANIHDSQGKGFRVIAKKPTYPDSETLFGETYDDLISEHGLSKESKFVNSLGDKVTARTRGLLARQPIQVTKVLNVGKEANAYDLVQAGLVNNEEEVLTIYERDPWEEMKPIVMNMSVEEIMRIFGYSKRMAYLIKSGRRRANKSIIQNLQEVRKHNPNA